MTKEQLYQELAYVNHSKENRKKYAHLVINNPHLLSIVNNILLMVNDKQSPRAGWLLEFVAREKLVHILPIVDTLTKSMHLITQDSAVRPVAKICEYLVEAYYKEYNLIVRKYLTPKLKERIISNCFDWLIEPTIKIAPKTYSMNCLYLLGKDFDWIYPELVQVLELNYQRQSTGYKARARQILKKINRGIN